MNDRYQICKQCEEFNDLLKTCKICHCFMPVKTKLPHAECPLKKWTKIEIQENSNDN